MTFPSEFAATHEYVPESSGLSAKNVMLLVLSSIEIISVVMSISLEDVSREPLGESQVIAGTGNPIAVHVRTTSNPGTVKISGGGA